MVDRKLNVGGPTIRDGIRLDCRPRKGRVAGGGMPSILLAHRERRGHFGQHGEPNLVGTRLTRRRVMRAPGARGSARVSGRTPMPG